MAAFGDCFAEAGANGAGAVRDPAGAHVAEAGANGGALRDPAGVHGGAVRAGTGARAGEAAPAPAPAPADHLGLLLILESDGPATPPPMFIVRTYVVLASNEDSLLGRLGTLYFGMEC